MIEGGDWSPRLRYGKISRSRELAVALRKSLALGRVKKGKLVLNGDCGRRMPPLVILRRTWKRAEEYKFFQPV